METDNKTYKPPPCSVFLVGNRRNQVAKIISPKKSGSCSAEKIQSLEHEEKQFCTLGKVETKKQTKNSDWKNFLEIANNSKFRPEEWVQRWLGTLEAVKKLDECTHDNNFMTNVLCQSDSGAEDSLSEFTWAGEWSGYYHPKIERESTGNEQYLFDGTSMQPLNKSKTKDYSIEGMHDDTSGLGSSEQRNESPTTKSFVTIGEQLHEFKGVEIFSEPNRVLFVTMNCENYADIGMNDKVNGRKVWIYQRETGDQNPNL